MDSTDLPVSGIYTHTGSAASDVTSNKKPRRGEKKSTSAQDAVAVLERALPGFDWNSKSTSAKATKPSKATPQQDVLLLYVETDKPVVFFRVPGEMCTPSVMRALTLSHNTWLTNTTEMTEATTIVMSTRSEWIDLQDGPVNHNGPVFVIRVRLLSKK